jgi:hydrogenase nickel incorporation protein HypB
MSVQTISVNRDLGAERRTAAEAFRRELTARGTFVVRLISSPGAGKTTLLEKTAQRLSPDYSVGILVGDVETERDAERLAPYAPTKQITTGGACHLELPLVAKSLPALGDQPFDFLFIEDVGNLICPASHDLGEHIRVILLSTTEGDDKPGKYPKAFRTSQVMVISKLDLLPYVPFEVERAIEDARLVQPTITIYPLCVATGEGMAAWYEFLVSSRRQCLGDPSP